MKTAKEIEAEILNLDYMPYDPIRQTQIEMLNEMLEYANKLESLSPSPSVESKPVSDAVEFAEWLTKNYVLFYNPDTTEEKSWFESGISENDIIFYNIKELYQLFLNPNGSKEGEKGCDSPAHKSMTRPSRDARCSKCGELW